MATATDRKLWEQWRAEIDKTPPPAEPPPTVSSVPSEPLCLAADTDEICNESIADRPASARRSTCRR